MSYLTAEQAIERIEQLTGRVYSEEQRDIFNTTGGISIAAVAGSGKTTVLVALICKRLLTGEIPDAQKILCTTFSKAGAEEVQTRLNALTSSLGLPVIKVCTLHAACYNILAHFGIKPEILSDRENNNLVLQAISNVQGKKVYLEAEQLEQVVSTISIMDNNLLTPAELIELGKYLLDYDIEEFKQIVGTYKELKRATGKFTFDDLLIGIYEWLCVAKHPSVIQYCREKYQYLFLDEFQDTNKVQFEIIKAILGADEPSLRPEDRLVVVGDDDQNVYEWRGTDPNIMINIRSVVDIKKRILSTNYRCKGNIVNSAMNCVRNMGTRQDKTMKAAVPGGKVELLDVTTSDCSVDFISPICRGSQLVADRILHDIGTQEHGVITDGHFCIMARTNVEVSIVANMLMRKGILLKQSSASMMLSKTPLWSTLKKIVGLSKPFTGPYKMQGILYQIVPFATNRMEELINDISFTCQCSLDWAIEYAIRAWNDNAPEFATMMLGDSKTAGKGMDGLTPVIASRAAGIMDRYRGLPDLILFINALRKEDTLGELLRCWYRSYADKATRMQLAVKEYLLHVYLELGKTDFEKYILTTEQAENKDSQAICDKRVELKTIHGAKGMEWNTVYILMDDNYSFPDLSKLQVLKSKYRVKIPVLKNYVDSERRLHYVAQTRAKNELYFVCPKKQASVFLEEAFGYTFTASTDALRHAQMSCEGCNDENGRIIYKALNYEFDSHDLKGDTCVE